MKRAIGSLLLLSLASAGALAQDKGSVTVGKHPGMKLAQAECQAAWAKLNPSKKEKISLGQAGPFLADAKAANSNSDGYIDQAEFTAACDKGLMKDMSGASTGSSTGAGGAAGTEGAGAPHPAAP